MADDWASSADKRLKEEEEKRRLKDERAIQIHKLLSEQGPNLFGEIKRKLGEELRNLNQKEGREVISFPFGPTEKADLYAKLDKGQRSAHAILEYDTIEYYAMEGGCDMPDLRGKFNLSVSDQGTLVLKDEQGNQQSSLDAAGQILNALMGWRS